MVRLNATGTVGFTDGYKWVYNVPSSGDIDADDDGVMSYAHGGLLDLSHIASQILGQQVAQSSNFTIHSINLGLKNVDDSYDNDEGNWFAGTFRWYYPTQHRLEAMKLARSAEKYSEGDEIDGDSFFLRTDNDYRGLRVGWMPNDGSGVANQVAFNTSEDFSALAGSEWNLTEIFQIYNQMHPATKANSLWGGRAGDKTCKLAWTAANASGVGVGDAPAIKTDFQSNMMSAKCLAGLLYFTVVDSGGDESGSSDDDYQVTVSVDFSVGVDA